LRTHKWLLALFGVVAFLTVIVHQYDLERGGYEFAAALERQYGVQPGELPEIFIGDAALIGNEEIQARLPGLIDFYLAQGGVALTPVQPLPTPTPQPAGAPPIYLAYSGTTSQQLGLFIHRHTATVKLATAGLFVLLAAWMVTTLV